MTTPKQNAHFWVMYFACTLSFVIRWFPAEKEKLFYWIFWPIVLLVQCLNLGRCLKQKSGNGQKTTRSFVVLSLVYLLLNLAYALALLFFKIELNLFFFGLPLALFGLLYTLMLKQLNKRQ